MEPIEDKLGKIKEEVNRDLKGVSQFEYYNDYMRNISGEQIKEVLENFNKKITNLSEV